MAQAGAQFGRVVRYWALGEYADNLKRQVLEAPPGEVRDGMLAEALAVRARMLELEREAA